MDSSLEILQGFGLEAASGIKGDVLTVLFALLLIVFVIAGFVLIRGALCVGSGQESYEKDYFDSEAYEQYKEDDE